MTKRPTINRKRLARTTAIVVVILLIIEFLDECTDGVRQAAWPLIRDEFSLSYLQVGALLSIPAILSNVIEPFLGVLGDVWRRKALILGGGMMFVAALLGVSLANGFWMLLIAYIVFYPASGAFVTLSQATLMDMAPKRRVDNMAKWTFAGSMGVVAGPLLLSMTVVLGGGWRAAFAALAVGAAILTCLLLPFSLRHPIRIGETSSFRRAFLEAITALRRREVLRWLILLQASDLLLDVLAGFIALYLVDQRGLTPSQGALIIAAASATSMIGDLIVIPVLRRVPPLAYVRVTAVLACLAFAGLLVATELWVTVGCLLAVQLLNSGWYAVLQARLYDTMPGRSGSVMAVGAVFGFLGGTIPFVIGLSADYFGIQFAMAMLLVGPVFLVLFTPRQVA